MESADVRSQVQRFSELNRRFPYTKADGTVGETPLSPGQQVLVQSGLKRGQGAISLAEELGISISALREYILQSEAVGKAAGQDDEMLAETYQYLRRNQFAIAAQRIERWSGFADRLLQLMEKALQGWDMNKNLITPTGMARLIREYRELDKMWLKFVELDLDVVRSDVRVTKTEQQLPPPITVESLIDRGLSTEQIASFIDVIEQSQQRRITGPTVEPGDNRDTEAPVPPSDAGEPGAFAL